jgi:thioredoxin-related protein
MSTRIKTIIVFGLILLLVYKEYRPQNIPTIIDNIPKIVVPDLKDNIVYDDLNKSIELASKHNRKVLIIFGADWCPYCKTLKKDISTLFIQKYVVSIIDIDKNSDIVDEFKIKGLPTSVVIDSNKKELARKIGYKKQEYEDWLKQNITDLSASWIDTK